VDALKVERIFPLKGPDVVDHTVGEGTLTASSHTHQEKDFLITMVVQRWREIHPANVDPPEILVSYLP
jgi:hypothetical protein